MAHLHWLFWSAAVLVVYAYVGYPALLMLLARHFGRPAGKTDALPSVTLLIAAHNEEAVIAARLENALALDYPGDRLEIMVVADGCTDDTCRIVERFADRGVRLVRQEPRQGKVSALNLGVPLSRGAIVVCTDANCFYRADALKKLVRNFADANVALVAGEKRILGKQGSGEGEGLYWRYENAMKRYDSLLGSAMGATGEIFAIRRELWRTVAADTIIEDFVITMDLVQRGFRVLYDPEAVSEETASPSARDEFKRKVRIAAGGWQAVVRLRRLLSPIYGWPWFQYVSHRVLRWVLVPWLLPLLLLWNAILFPSAGVYRLTFFAQLAIYSAAALGWLLDRRGIRWKVAYVPFYLVFLNVAAILGAWRYLTHTQPVTWEKVRRSLEAVPSRESPAA
jgi:cellulose synthase/poly-beta-1,6-N-acetylglucosamine synthase-like glycosyltransferase